MTLWRCNRCRTRFAVGLHCCPQCTATDCEEDGMPKTARRGPSNASGAGDAPDAPAPEVTKEEPWPGNSSSASTPKPPTNDEPSEPSGPKPARTTERRSSKGRKGSSTARSTGGSGLETDD